MQLFNAKKALPLAFHVDYWDNLGWRDPFSLSLATNRQRQYTEFYHSESLFTPMMTVNGQLGFNGGDLSQAQSEYSQSTLLKGLAPLTIKTLLGHQAFRVQVDLSADTQNLSNPTLNVAVFENGFMTKVLGGENSGRFLEENFVVRYHHSVLVSDLAGGPGLNLSIPVDSSWNLSHAGVAVWLQDGRTQQSQGLNWVYPLQN